MSCFLSKPSPSDLSDRTHRTSNEFNMGQTDQPVFLIFTDGRFRPTGMMIDETASNLSMIVYQMYHLLL